jgi:hypothetical protein
LVINQAKSRYNSRQMSDNRRASNSPAGAAGTCNQEDVAAVNLNIINLVL